MSLRARFVRGLAGQLGRPEGLRGRMVGRLLNRGNRRAVVAAIEATGLQAGQVGADIGFGGGLGLGLMLERVGAEGRVQGVELSQTMLTGAQRHYRPEVTAGRLVLRSGELGRLPLADQEVDGLITVNTLYFVEDLAAAFRELARVLKPSGCAVVGVADPAFMAGLPVTAYGFRIRPPEELVSGLEDAGLTVRHERVGDDDRAFHLLLASHR